MSDRDFSYASGERQIATRFEDIRADHRVRYSLVVERLPHLLGEVNGAYGLDMFCGNGYGSGHISASLPGLRMLGIDGSEEAVAIGSRLFATPSTLFAAKIFPFNLPLAAFDFAVSFESMEHTEQDHQFLRGLCSAVKPGGLLFLSVPNEKRLPFAGFSKDFHCRHYTFDDLTMQLKVWGMEIVEWYGQDTYVMEGITATALLHENDMALKKETDGQFLIFIARKKS